MTNGNECRRGFWHKFIIGNRNIQFVNNMSTDEVMISACSLVTIAIIIIITIT